MKDKGNVVMITPAKWQTKGGKKNEDFRKNIVTHMKEIVYYKDSKDVFDIGLSGGLSIFSVDSSIYPEKNITIMDKGITSHRVGKIGAALDISIEEQNIYDKIDALNEPKVTDNSSKFKPCNTYICIRYNGSSHTNAEVKRLISRVGTGIYFVGKDERIEIGREFVAHPNRLDKYHLCTVAWISSNINLRIINPNEVVSDHDTCLYEASNLDEILSVKSYYSCKLIRYLMYKGHEGLMVAAACDRIPSVAFDHIFTDEELYKKYNLTPEEINIIESVIKAR